MADNTPASQPTDPRLRVLHLLRLGGFVSMERLAERADIPVGAVEPVLQQVATDGLAIERTGRISGWTLTADGKIEHAALLAAELEATGARTAVERGNEVFLELNEPFKELCSRWQIRPDGTPNNHSDPDYDATVSADLGPLHERVTALTAELAEHLPRFGRYPRAFTAVRDRLAAGDIRAFTAPMSESYHDVWMELHQDLLSTLGRERSKADGH